MKFKVTDTVRVVKSELEAYIGLEGMVIAVRSSDDSAIFNLYTLRTHDGRRLDFFEYQLELA